MYTWDGASGTWKRSHPGRAAHRRGSGEQIAPTNVVVQFTDYAGEGDGQTVGEGDVWVFTDGQLRTGRWMRPDRAQPARYVDAQRRARSCCVPARTWVELLPVG